MRVTVLLLTAMIAAPAAVADIRVTTRHGRKFIYNVGSAKSRTANDDRWLASRHDRRTEYDPIIERHARRYRVDPVLVRAVIQVESNFDPNCVSRKGARGLMQLMPATAKRYGVDKIHDPDQNIRGGVRYLRDLLEMFPGDLPRALAAYNAGENAVIRHGGIPPYEETDTYVKRALTVYYGRPYGQAIGFAGRSSGKPLRGGFAESVTPPVAAAVLPGIRYLGSQ